MTIEERIAFHRENVENICRQCGRNSDDVKIIAVTKTRSAEEINRAIHAGLNIIGENRVQELIEKYEDIDKSAQIHLIGQLQTNKVKYILDKVSLIHSLDRISLAEQLEKTAEKMNIPKVETLIEVNIGLEDTKSGILPDKLTEFLDILTNFMYISPVGLMTVAPASADEYQQNVYFAQMQSLLLEGQKVFGKTFSQLSMGMSRDYPTAIKHGATMVRLGTALFGERNYNI